MNVQSIVLLMAIMAVGSMGAASQAFADHHSGDAMGTQHGDTPVPLSIESNGVNFDHNSTIEINGQVGNMRSGTPITLIVTGSTGVVTIEQLTPSSDGSFAFSINTASPLMKYDGEYKIKATYGDAGINDVIVVTLEGGLVKQAPSHSDDEEHHEAADFTKQLNYNISGGMVESITATNDDSLLVSIHMAEDDGELTIALSEDIITPFNDGTFFVLVNGEESDDANQMGNQLIIPFDSTTTDIEIIGTHVVPEFGTIAMIVLAVAIVSIIAVSAKSRLSIMPRI
ncbi:MAG: PEFG-CTERM sorting domain-containing protein [Thaumarchaeota archaeon]|nr:PEFG-CTERM sorting domain-containing protein [Nitrososphaerota archaeon]MBT4176629.1 PEFG-CTERM sorting domain-containing protein [Nitrososphaerota archaeon]MBT4509850.1 PEFG-CTERM sorting domain-containing protein [Nitrososphaerota archaeon]MBT4675925.1 PEFG-CTERM sorting domain-containing protein [Nitrososphaerota archaeon]MBT6171258.1 PEFG-CTERM sorting domain-containing protein [Nitrososphaerota archaeon]